MAFCQKCGAELVLGAKFCANCGTPAGETGNENDRKQSYDGEIKKCPNCGAVLPAGAIECPSCGYELRNIEISKALKEFQEKYTNCCSDSSEDGESASTKQSRLVTAFQIPNTKEDYFEFLIMAKGEVEKEFDGFDDLHKAWVGKFTQLKTKAIILFAHDQSSLKQAKEIIKSTKIRKLSGYIKVWIVLGIIMIILLVFQWLNGEF